MVASPRRVLLVGLLLLAPAFAGCVANPLASQSTHHRPSRAPTTHPLASLGAVGANATRTATTLTWTWHAVGGRGAEDPVLGTPLGNQSRTNFTFQVGPGVHQLYLHLRWNASDLQSEGDQNMTYGFEVRNATGAIFCTAYLMQNPESCGGPLPTNLSSVENWTATVETQAAPAGGVPFVLQAVLDTAVLPQANLSSFTDPNVTYQVVETGGSGGEPSMGLDGSGHVFVLAGLRTLRSSDGGSTWQDVSAPTTSKITLDPDMTADPYTHRVFVDQLTVACSILAWSSDAGGNWSTNPAACGLPSDDHEKLATGDAVVPNPVYNGTVYYAFHSIGYHPAYDDVVVSRSVDGGASFTPVVAADGARDNYTGGPTGPVYADQHGNVIIAWPVYEPDGLWVAVSHDHGQTYHAEPVAMGHQFQPPSDPAAFFDPAGNAYIVWAGTNQLYYTVSTDGGSTWSTPQSFGPKALRGYVFTAAKPGDAGSFAVAFYGSEQAVYGPDAAPMTATWHLFVDTVTNATTDHPSVTTALVSHRALQRGGICMMGTACTGGDRNLLDFIDLVVGPHGHPMVTFTDGCGGCAIPADSHHATNLFAVETRGPSLYASGLAPWARDGS